MVRRDRSEAAAADRGHARTLRLDPPPCLRMISRRGELLLPGAHLQRERALRRLGEQLVRREAMADLVRQAEPLEAAGREDDRVEATLAALPETRVDIAARRRIDAVPMRMPGRTASAPQSASRASSRSRYAATARPSVSVDVMSFAE